MRIPCLILEERGPTDIATERLQQSPDVIFGRQPLWHDRRLKRPCLGQQIRNRLWLIDADNMPAARISGRHSIRTPQLQSQSFSGKCVSHHGSFHIRTRPCQPRCCLRGTLEVRLSPCKYCQYGRSFTTSGSRFCFRRPAMKLVRIPPAPGKPEGQQWFTDRQSCSCDPARRRVKAGLGDSCAGAAGPNAVWATGFGRDRPTLGQKLRIATVVALHARCFSATDLALHHRGEDVTRIPERICRKVGSAKRVLAQSFLARDGHTPLAGSSRGIRANGGPEDGCVGGFRRQEWISARANAGPV